MSDDFTEPGYGCYSSPDPENFPVGVVIVNNFTCAAGYYCPNIVVGQNKTKATFCPPSTNCSLTRLRGQECEPQGKYEPIICPGGYYCPTFEKKFICPKGKFCPTGTVEPRTCGALSICNEGTVIPIQYLGIVICLAIDIFLIFMFILLKIREYKKKNIPLILLLPSWLRFGKTINITSTKSTSELPQSENETNLSILMKYFTKALGSQQLAMNFSFDNLQKQLSYGKSILQGITGTIRSGRMTAIMGPSGAGKTTFMSVLMGKVPRTSGKLMVNGKGCEIYKFKKVIGYVPQDDIMLRELTVREIIYHSARIRLPGNWSNAEINDFVDKILQSLNLAHVQNSIIGDETTRGISGGQRKRVNIGMEVAAAPLALFLDEPTSGLDSTASLQVAQLLKSITDLGMTIVSVIHQPRIEIFQTFDDCLLLVPGGKTAYLGPVKDVVSYFSDLGFVFEEGRNPADLIMDILSEKGVNTKAVMSCEDLVKAWSMHCKEELSNNEENTKFHENISNVVKERGANILFQTGYCLMRSLKQQFNSVNGFCLEILVASIAGALMGLSINGTTEMYRGFLWIPYILFGPLPREWQVPLYGLLNGITCSIAAAPSAVKVFGEERPVYWREAAAGHSKLGYYLGKIVATIPRYVLSSLHFASLYHFLSANILSFQMQYSLIFLLFFGIYGMSALLSFVVRRENASLVAVVVCLFASVFCGYGPSLNQAKDWGVIFVFELQYNKWLAEAQFSESITPYAHVYNMTQSASLWGYTINRTGFNLWIAFIIGIVYRIIGYIFLIFFHRDKQH